MSVADNAAVAIDKGVGTVESLGAWLADNVEGLMIGLGVAAVIVLAMLGVRWIGGRMLAGDPHCTRWRGVVGRVLTKTMVWFMVAAALEVVVTYAIVPPRLARLVDILFIIALSLQAAIWTRELILGAIARRVGDDGGSTLGNASTIVRILVSVAVFALALVVILDNLGANVTALIAGLGVGGIAIGLAAQGIFADLFAALSILFDKPFRKGDVIKYGTTTGTVERIGLKTTRLRSISGEQVIMGNTKLLDQEITNAVVETATRRIWLHFGLVYQTSPDVLESLPKLLDKAVASVSSCKLVRCVATNFGDSSIDCELVYDDHTINADALAKHKSAVIIAVMRIFAREGIEFAYPTQTSFTAAPDGTFVMPYAEGTPVVIDPDDTGGLKVSE